VRGRRPALWQVGLSLPPQRPPTASPPIPRACRRRSSQ
jgi:DNA-binding winged helix-turn-helix (wHTH) protein